MAEIARKLGRDIPDLAERPGVAEFEHVIVTGFAEIIGRPVVVEFDFELVVEQVARDAAPKLEIVEIAGRIEGPWIGDVIGCDIEFPFAQCRRDAHVVVDFEARDILAIRAGTKVNVRRPNASVENLLIGEIELGLHSRLFRRVRNPAIDVLRQQRGGATQRDVTFGIGRESRPPQKAPRPNPPDLIIPAGPISPFEIPPGRVCPQSFVISVWQSNTPRRVHVPVDELLCFVGK